jgi:hypothetical protein
LEIDSDERISACSSEWMAQCCECAILGDSCSLVIPSSPSHFLRGAAWCTNCHWTRRSFSHIKGIVCAMAGLESLTPEPKLILTQIVWSLWRCSGKCLGECFSHHLSIKEFLLTNSPELLPHPLSELLRERCGPSESFLFGICLQGVMFVIFLIHSKLSPKREASWSSAAWLIQGCQESKPLPSVFLIQNRNIG